jgi:hypothetical protein
MIFETRSVEWNVPTPRYLFEAERDAGVRTDGLLARQTSDRLDAIMRAIEAGVRRYAKGDRFAIPMAAHVIVASQNSVTQGSSLFCQAGCMHALRDRAAAA